MVIVKQTKSKKSLSCIFCFSMKISFNLFNLDVHAPSLLLVTNSGSRPLSILLARTAYIFLTQASCQLAKGSHIWMMQLAHPQLGGDQYILPLFENVGRFDFSRFIMIAKYLDITYVQIYIAKYINLEKLKRSIFRNGGAYLSNIRNGDIYLTYACVNLIVKCM